MSTGGTETTTTRPETTVAGSSETAVVPERPIIAQVQVVLTALLHREEEGGFWAEVPALPGCLTGGETLEEVMANVREAAELCLAARHDHELASPR